MQNLITDSRHDPVKMHHCVIVVVQMMTLKEKSMMIMVLVLAQIHVGIPRSMHCWHCSESYHFVARITPNYWKTKRLNHYWTNDLLITFWLGKLPPKWKIGGTKKPMKIPGMPSLRYFIAVDNEVLLLTLKHRWDVEGKGLTWRVLQGHRHESNQSKTKSPVTSVPFVQ